MKQIHDMHWPKTHKRKWLSGWLGRISECLIYSVGHRWKPHRLGGRMHFIDLSAKSIKVREPCDLLLLLTLKCWWAIVQQKSLCSSNDSMHRPFTTRAMEVSPCAFQHVLDHNLYSSRREKHICDLWVRHELHIRCLSLFQCLVLKHPRLKTLSDYCPQHLLGVQQCGCSFSFYDSQNQQYVYSTLLSCGQ